MYFANLDIDTQPKKVFVNSTYSRMGLRTTYPKGKYAQIASEGHEEYSGTQQGEYNMQTLM
jgi:hypothetical protein